jgi:DNA-binding LacI/PurR family transcriptional regulator
MDDLISPYILDHMRAVERTVRKAGYRLIVASSDGSEVHERACLRLFREHRLDGIILVPCSLESPPAVELHRQGVPMVLMARYLRDAPMDLVARQGSFT